MRRNLAAKALAATVILTGVAACGGDTGPMPPGRTPPPPPPPPPPVAPVQVGTIPDQTVETGQTATLDVSSFFRDPDGGALTYTAVSSAPAVVAVSVSGSTLTMAGVADGTGTVTVTAADPGGLTAMQSFDVTVGTEDDHSCVRGQETPVGWAGAVGGVLTAGDEDCFAVVVPAAAAGGRLAAWTTGPTDTYGYLYDNAYDTIDEDDDYWRDWNFLVADDTASSGTYYIRVQGYDETTTGPYVIHVDDHGNSLYTATSDWEPEGGRSLVGTGSIAVPGNRDFFHFRVLFDSILVRVGTAGRTDTYGALYDDEGATIGEDNDSGPDRNFLIESRLDEGTYFIEVRGFGNSTGPYGLGIRAVPVGPRDSDLPAWSPDGSRIAFTSNRDGNDEVYSINADGTGATRLTDSFVDNWYPAWSPDGARIAFSSVPDDQGGEIYVMNADGTGVTRLTHLTGTPPNLYSATAPAWSPDGARIAFTGTDWVFDSEIYTMNADGTGVTRLTDDGGRDAAWSPDGAKVAFSSDRDRDPEIYTMNADGTGVERLMRLARRSAEDLHYALAPAWSPDGSRIAFTGSDAYDDYEVYVMNADGTGVTRLTGNSADEHLFSAAEPAWSPDGSRIAFTADRDHLNDEIYVMNADGTGVTRLTTTYAGDHSADGAAPPGRTPLLHSVRELPVPPSPRRPKGPRSSGG